MSINVSSWSELEVILQKVINESLENEVAEGGIECGKEHVDTDVYDAYISQYDRTGLLRESFESKMLDSNTLEITNTRSDGDRNIPEVIEYGKGYYSSALDERIGERPFMENTHKELSEGLARELLIKGLARKLGTSNVF